MSLRRLISLCFRRYDGINENCSTPLVQFWCSSDIVSTPSESILTAPNLHQGLHHNEERVRIIGEARSLAASGLAGEAVGNWICREVARTVGGLIGFYARDANGNVIDPPYVAEARMWITSAAGRTSQIKRNTNLQQWRERCKQMVAAGLSESEVFHRALAAIQAYHRKLPIPLGFEGLQIIYGLDGRSPPKDKKRLRSQLFGRVRSSN